MPIRSGKLRVPGAVWTLGLKIQDHLVQCLPTASGNKSEKERVEGDEGADTNMAGARPTEPWWASLRLNHGE